MSSRALTPPFSWSSDSIHRGSGVLFVDRDGVVNRQIEGGYVISWQGFVPAEPFVRNARRIVACEIPIVIVSNQSCVGRGLIDMAGIVELFAQMTSYLRELGVPIAAYFCCPHTPEDGCWCRKPKPGLLLEAQRRLGVDLKRSAMIGDQGSDIAAGVAAGVYSLLVNANEPRTYASTFYEAARFILHSKKGSYAALAAT
jgi:D-glycero-D-manno-heptose 1,7-bisphosphate phosphatase